MCKVVISRVRRAVRMSHLSALTAYGSTISAINIGNAIVLLVSQTSGDGA